MSENIIKENGTENAADEFPELTEDVQEALEDIENFGKETEKLPEQDKNSENPSLPNTQTENAKIG